jgi:hypothetical protein
VHKIVAEIPEDERKMLLLLSDLGTALCGAGLVVNLLRLIFG